MPAQAPQPRDEAATSPDAEPERRLVRPREGRVLGGVCAGLGRYFGLDPLVYRVAFAALVLLGGSGLLLYAAVWLVVPDEEAEDSILGEVLRERRPPAPLLVGVGLVAFALIVSASAVDLWRDPTDFWLAVLAAAAAVVAWQLWRRESRASAPVAPRAAGAEGEPAAAGEPEGAPPPPPRHRSVFLPTLGILIVAAGVLSLLRALDVVELDWTLVLAGAVILVGLAVAIGAFFGRAGALAALGVALAALLAVAAALDLPFHGRVGDRTERPASVAALEDKYELAVGHLEVDLRQVALLPGTTELEASVGIGKLVVYVPAGAALDLRGHVTAGKSEILGRSEDGWEVDQAYVSAGPAAAAPRLVLDARVGFGQLEVREE